MKVFNDVRARYALRAVLAGVLSLLVGLQAGSSLRDAAIAAGVASLGYLGVGAAVPAVEPNIGAKKK